MIDLTSFFAINFPESDYDTHLFDLPEFIGEESALIGDGTLFLKVGARQRIRSLELPHPHSSTYAIEFDIYAGRDTLSRPELRRDSNGILKRKGLDGLESLMNLAITTGMPLWQRLILPFTLPNIERSILNDPYHRQEVGKIISRELDSTPLQKPSHGNLYHFPMGIQSGPL